jgi:GntR family transcriptional regulator
LVYILALIMPSKKAIPPPPPPPLDRAGKREQLKRGLQAILQQTGDGMRLPPERELAERLGVARETLRRTLQEMQTDGLLQRRQGAGTFVAGQSWVKPLLLRSFTEDMRERGLVASSTLLSTRTLRADVKVATKLKAVPGSLVFEIRRLRLANGEPMALEHTFLSADRLPGFDPACLATQSLYEVLAREHGIVARNAAQEIQATVVTEDEARWLDVAPFSPALLVERQVFSTEGEPVEFGKSLYRADRYRFEVNVGRATAGDDTPSR